VGLAARPRARTASKWMFVQASLKESASWRVTRAAFVTAVCRSDRFNHVLQRYPVG
jgi:hypothetical protein